MCAWLVGAEPLSNYAGLPLGYVDFLPMTVSKSETLTFDQQKWQDELTVLREELALKKRNGSARV